MKKTILSFLILIFCVFGSFAQESYWRFENNWNDEKGNHNGAGVNYAGFSTSSVLEGSYRASFNNSTGNRMVTSNYVDLSSGAVTISLGILFYNSSGTGLILTNKQTLGGKGFAIIVDKTNKRIVVATNNGTSEESAYSANNSLTQSSWNHVVVRFMDINGAYSKIFVNGVQSGTDSVGLGGSAQSQYIVMGAYADNNSTLYEYIDNVQIYKAALTDVQITDLYNNRMNNYTVTTSTVAVTGVSVIPTTASVAIGGTTTLTANVAPTNATNKTVSWSSSNTSVATVSSSGVVTGVAAGSATITVTTQDGSKTATSVITVTTSTVAVTSVAVSPTSASVPVGSITTLTATVSPTNATNKTVSWSSSNSSVASVSSAGVVTGVAAGSATITVTTQDGNKTATCAITVTNVAVTGVTVSPASAPIAAGATVTLTATVAPTNATNKNVTWSTSNSAIATVSTAGIVTGVANGSATITVTTVDQSKTATCAVTVSGTATGDNLGNHMATMNIKLNDKWLSNDGGDKGIRIDNSGNVGIGITIPSTQLHIKNTANDAFLTVETGINYKFAGIKLIGYHNTTTATSQIYMDYYGVTNNHGLNYISGRTDYSNHWFKNSSGNVQMCILNNGNVGIGTTNPTTKLTVNGKILATEVEVVSSIASDFVFAPEYKLMPLSKLEVYLKQHRHLPEVKSAKEFAEKRQNLGEMDDLLLRKIEELTLYIIVQNMKIEALQAEMETLHKKSKKME
jgi:uncharacterized protein YjdB